MSYRGDISSSSDIRVELSARGSNSGSALLIGGSAVAGGSRNADSTVVVPGGADHVDIRTPKTGLMQIMVDFKDASDSGDLQVFVNGVSVDSDTIRGDLITWTYSVV